MRIYFDRNELIDAIARNEVCGSIAIVQSCPIGFIYKGKKYASEDILKRRLYRAGIDTIIVDKMHEQ